MCAKDDANRSSRFRAWCFTWNNYPDDAVDRLKGVDCLRMVVGREVSKTGTPHLQGYVRFANPVSFSWWKIRFPSVHVEVRKYSETEASQYCKKDGIVAIDRGVDYDEKVDTKDMTRNEEARMIIDEIENGASYGVIRQRHKVFCFWYRRNVVDYWKDERMSKTDPDIKGVDTV